MAIAIKSVPTLKDRAARDFEKRILDNSAKRATVDYSKQVTSLHSILSKANLK